MNIFDTPYHNITTPNYPINTTGYCQVIYPDNKVSNITQPTITYFSGPQIDYVDHTEEIKDLKSRVETLEKFIEDFKKRYPHYTNEQN